MFGYVSTAAVPFSDRDLSDLLLAARRTNVLHGVTGKLVVLESRNRVLRFAQVVEGTPEGLRVVVERIRADPRHMDIQVVLDGPVRRRRFENWDMAIEAVPEARFERATEVLMA